MVLEDGQSLGDGHLHADTVLLLCEARALTVQEELGPERGQGLPQATGSPVPTPRACDFEQRQNTPGTSVVSLTVLFCLGLPPTLRQHEALREQRTAWH